MATVNIYLTFNGDCEQAFDFYKSILGGEYVSISRFKEMPESPEFEITESDKEKIMHVTLPISKETMLMGSDTAAASAANFKQGNNFSISITADSKEEADRLFGGLSEGGKIIMPMNMTFWESYFGMLTDKFGVQWMVSFDEAR